MGCVWVYMQKVELRHWWEYGDEKTGIKSERTFTIKCNPCLRKLKVKILEKPEKQTQCAVNLYKSSFPKKNAAKEHLNNLFSMKKAINAC